MNFRTDFIITTIYGFIFLNTSNTELRYYLKVYKTLLLLPELTGINIGWDFPAKRDFKKEGEKEEIQAI